VFVRKITTVLFLILSVILISLPVAAQTQDPGLAYAPRSGSGDLLPSTLEHFRSSHALTANAVEDFSPALSGSGGEVLTRPASLGLAEPENADGGGKSYLPVLFSALLPGTGEIYLGYNWRGAALLTLEVLAWTGYFYYHNEGLESREAYENYADIHWDQRKWIDDHPDVYPLTGITLEELEEIGRDKLGGGEWPGYIVWVSKEEDKQHYYENIGKYDWYISGWADFDPQIDDPFMMDTPLRDQYRAMRKESNDQLDDANKFIYLSLGTRVFSIVETLFLVRSSEARAADAADNHSQNHFRFRTRALGWQGAEVSLEYNFK
jgi:hypothetical protein